MLKEGTLIKPKGRKHSQILQGVGWKIVASSSFPLGYYPLGTKSWLPAWPFQTLPQEGDWGTTLQQGKEEESRVLAFARRGVGGELQYFLVALGWSRVLIV